MTLRQLEASRYRVSFNVDPNQLTFIMAGATREGMQERYQALLTELFGFTVDDGFLEYTLTQDMKERYKVDLLYDSVNDYIEVIIRSDNLMNSLLAPFVAEGTDFVSIGILPNKFDMSKRLYNYYRAMPMEEPHRLFTIDTIYTQEWGGHTSIISLSLPLESWETLSAYPTTTVDNTEIVAEIINQPAIVAPAPVVRRRRRSTTAALNYIRNFEEVNIDYNLFKADDYVKIDTWEDVRRYLFSKHISLILINKIMEKGDALHTTQQSE